MELSDNLWERDREINQIAKDFFEIDFENSEFHVVMLSSLISLLLNKGIITEEEYEREVDSTGTAYKLLKHRNNLQKGVDKPEK